MPGLVDAHCHLGLDDDGADQRRGDRAAGDRRPRRRSAAHPRLRLGGRHLLDPRARGPAAADPGRPAHRPDEALHPQLRPRGRAATSCAAYVAQEAQRGDGWVKLVGDWISRDEGDLAPSFPPEAFAEAIRVAHEHGAKVTAHCFGNEVLAGLLDAGIDCIEHGTGLSTDLIDQMVAGSVALVPTVMQLDKFPQYAEAGGAKFPDYADHDDRPARPATRHDHGRPRGRGRHLRRVRRRRRDPARQPLRRGGRPGRDSG